MQAEVSKNRSIKAGQTAVATGAALGIGRATVRCLAELGLRVVMTDKAPAALAPRGRQPSRRPVEIEAHDASLYFDAKTKSHRRRRIS